MLKLKINKNDILPLMFCILTSIYYTLKGWKYNFGYLELFLGLGAFFGFLHIFRYMRTSIKSFIMLLPIMIVIVYRLSLNSDTRLAISLLAIFIGKSVDFNKISRWIFSTKTFVFIFALLIGGYDHKNYIAVNIGVLMFLELYIYYEENKKRAMSIAIAMYMFAVMVSGSGAMIICAGVGLILYMFLDIPFAKKYFFKKPIAFIFPFVLFINWFLVVLYAAYGYANPHFYFIKKYVPAGLATKLPVYMVGINRFLSGRINLAAYSLEKFGVSLWGGNIDYSVDTGLPYFLIDSGMMLLIQDGGIILTIVLMIFLTFMMWKLVEKKEYFLIISGVVIALWAFNEDTLLSVGTNYMYFVLGGKLLNRKKE